MRALRIANIERECGALRTANQAGVVTEIELGTVSAKVRFAHVVIGADDTTLEDLEEVFGGAAVLETASGDVFLRAVIYGAVPGKLAAHAGLDRAFVGHKVAGSVNLGNDKAAHFGGGDVSNMIAGNVAVTFNKGDNRLVCARSAGSAALGLSANIGFIDLYNLVRAAEGPQSTFMASRMRWQRNHAVL